MTLLLALSLPLSIGLAAMAPGRFGRNGPATYLRAFARSRWAWVVAVAVSGHATLGCNASEPALELHQPPPPPQTQATATAPRPLSNEPDAPDLYDPSLYLTTAIADRERRELVEYGKALSERTHAYIGPQVEDAAMRFAGNGLACKNCHIDAGLRPFAAPWVGVAKRYPKFRARDNRVGTLEHRINGCMERSMNGQPLPEDGREMRALVAWMEWLSHRTPNDGQVDGIGFERFPFPDREVDLGHGKTVYDTKCASCHQAGGEGQPNPLGGYFFPPIAGEDAYNEGAGMNRVLTAAAFVYNNMPFGATHGTRQLSIAEAFDVAGYIDSLPRPSKAELAADFPDRKRKPMSTPYGPWDDDFSAKQHKYGPFREIHDYYLQTHNLDKAK